MRSEICSSRVFGSKASATQPLAKCAAAASANFFWKSANEPNEIALDAGSGAAQDYVEDCQVCCRPWRVTVYYNDAGGAEVAAVPLDD